MKKQSFTFFFILTLFNFNFVNAITLVYNMRIRRSFDVGRSSLNKEREAIWLATFVPIIYKRDRHIIDDELKLNLCEKRLSGGSLFNLRYIPSRRCWFDLTTGFEKENVKSTGTKKLDFSRGGCDDIVLSGGFNFFPTQNMQLVFYGLSGFPTKRKVTLNEAQDTLVGTRFFSLGAGSEFSYNFINQLKRSLIFVFQNRFIHFFSRHWAPILPNDDKIQPGNTTDLLITLQYREKKDIIETGYNPTFFTNQAVILENKKVKGKNAIRNSWYASYSHLFKELPFVGLPGIIGTGLSVARSNKLETKIFSWWSYISIVF